MDDKTEKKQPEDGGKRSGLIGRPEEQKEQDPSEDITLAGPSSSSLDFPESTGDTTAQKKPGDEDRTKAVSDRDNTKKAGDNATRAASDNGDNPQKTSDDADSTKKAGEEERLNASQVVSRILKETGTGQGEERTQHNVKYDDPDFDPATSVKGLPSDLDKYEIIEELNRGGMGVIYKARQKDLDRIVALKVLISGALASEHDRARFYREAQACANLHHPNIVSIYEIGQFEDTLYFSMDYVNGAPLDKYSAMFWDDFSDKRKLEMMVKILGAVQYGHSQGIVHRDLKPANILINEFKEPVILDFGIAKRLDTEEHSTRNLTEAGEILGTPHYMAPEQAAGETDQIDARTDVFALGVIAYELFTLKRPFNGKNIREIFNSIFNTDPVAPLKINRKLDWETEAIILKALDKQPDLRYQSAEEMQDDINRFLSGEPVKAKKISNLYYLKKRIKRHKFTAVLVMLMFFMVVGAAVWGGRNVVRIRKGILAEREDEQEQLAELNETNTELKSDILKLVDTWKFTEARELRSKIENNVSDIKRIISESNVGVTDEYNYTRIWSLENEELKRIIARKEDEAKREDRLQRCGALTVAGGRLLEKAVSMLSLNTEKSWREGFGDARGAIRSFENALNILPGFESARQGKYDGCILIIEKSISARKFDVADQYLWEAKRVVQSEKEKEKIDTLTVAYTHGRNEKEKYDRFVADGRELFAKNNYTSSLAKFEAAEKTYATPEVKEWLNRTRYKIETAKADELQREGKYFEAVNLYRSAQTYTSEKVEIATIEEWINTLLEKGITEKLAVIDRQIEQKNYPVALKELDALLVKKKDDGEIVKRKQNLLDLMAVPPDMVFVERGEFEKGTPEVSVGNPVAKQTIESFYIAKHEITNLQYKEFLDAGAYKNKKYWDKKGWEKIKTFVSLDGHQGPGLWQNGGFAEGMGDAPVRGISLYEARAYARWYSGKTGRAYKLPSEYQWEKAASWDMTIRKRHVYPWGDEWKPDMANFTDEICCIGSFPSDVSPYGCLDMGGNVHEWTLAAEDESTGIIKGGAADTPKDLARVMARSSYRTRPYDGFRGMRVGFRLIISLKGDSQ